jgi:hypothetical protein
MRQFCRFVFLDLGSNKKTPSYNAQLSALVGRVSSYHVQKSSFSLFSCPPLFLKLVAAVARQDFIHLGVSPLVFFVCFLLFSINTCLRKRKGKNKTTNQMGSPFFYEYVARTPVFFSLLGCFAFCLCLCLCVCAVFFSDGFFAWLHSPALLICGRGTRRFVW